MDLGLCSIIIPVYNVEDYLEECLQSILEQTYKNYEVILIDDGSKDRSKEICDQYSKRYGNIKVIHEKNAGVSCARNLGLEKSKGKYISFIDPDDIIEKNFLEDMLQTLCENRVDVVCCTYYRILNGKKLITMPSDLKMQRFMGIEAFKHMVKKDIFSTAIWNKIYTRESVFHDKNLFNRFEDGLTVGEDEKWLLNLLDNSHLRVAFFEVALYGWRIREKSALNSALKMTIQKKDNIKTQECILKRAIELRDAEFENIMKAKLYKETLYICKDCYKSNDIDTLGKIYKKMSGCRRDFYLHNLNGAAFKMLMWDGLMWLKIKRKR